MMTKKLALLFSVAVLSILLVPTLAFANFAIHGNYVQDTDACAGCHRAHTSVSSITWTDKYDGTTQHSALLVSSATEIWEFCYACHGADAQGADTNVQQGVYEGTDYGAQFAVLNGGGFETVGIGGAQTSSTHLMNGSSWGAYGGGIFGQGTTGATGQLQLDGYADANTGESVQIKMDCVSCHDPHGSPNYRILISQVNGNNVGGYQIDGTPDGFVSSVETGWPVNGFVKRTMYPAYQPNYTTPMYAKGYDQSAASLSDGSAGINRVKGMSGWCSGCHSTYLGDFGGAATTTITKSDGTTYTANAGFYNANDNSGYKLRHRHPINVALNTFNGVEPLVVNSGLPLANDISEQGAPTVTNTDWIECLTCHRAHGTAASMTGWATKTMAASIVDSSGVSTNEFPASESALLRRDNRGVCESCHNK